MLRPRLCLGMMILIQAVRAGVLLDFVSGLLRGMIGDCWREYRVVESFPEFSLNDGDDAAWLLGGAAVISTIIGVRSVIRCSSWVYASLLDLPGLG